MSIIRYLPFAGRLMIGLPFAMSGLSKLSAYSATTAMISAVGLPIPPLAYAVTVAVELGGGLLLIAGYHARSIAAALALFSIAAALSFHSNFIWRHGYQRRSERHGKREGTGLRCRLRDGSAGPSDPGRLKQFRRVPLL